MGLRLLSQKVDVQLRFPIPTGEEDHEKNGGGELAGPGKVLTPVVATRTRWRMPASAGFLLHGTALPRAADQGSQLVHGFLEPAQPFGRRKREAQPCLATAVAIKSPVERAFTFSTDHFLPVRHRWLTPPGSWPA